MPNTLSIENLSCEKGEQLLFENLSFSVQEGEALQIRGVNGSGKTSLLRIIAGLSQPTTGTVNWNQQTIHKCFELYCAELNYIGHKLGLKDELTAHENLAFICRISGRNEHLVSDALISLGLADKNEIPLRSLSAGQKRRTALAKLRLSPAKLWILDEPFTAIDQDGVALLVHLMESHLQNNGMIVFTSHQDIPLKSHKQELYLS